MSQSAKGAHPKVARPRGWRVVKFTGRGRVPVSGWYATEYYAHAEERRLVATRQYAATELQLREYWLNAGPCTRKAYVSREEGPRE